MTLPIERARSRRPVTWLTSRSRIVPASLTGLAVTFATTGTKGAAGGFAPSASAIASAAGCISGQ